MNFLSKVTVLVAGQFLLGNAAAQEANAALQQFQSFFHNLTGDEWVYHTQMTGADGETVFEGSDIRTFEFGIRGRFVIGNVYSRDDDGGRTHIALQLLGLDAKTGAINASQFWPWQSTTLGDVNAHFEKGEDGELQFAGTARPAGLQHPLMSFRCRFDGPDVYSCETRTREEDGAEYLSNRETFSRQE